MEPKIRFKGFSGEWETRHVGELCDVLTGFPFEGSKILPKGKELLMRGINITEGYIRHSDEIDRYFDEDASSLSKYRLHKNDLVIGMDGSKVGKNSALVTDKEVNSLLVQRVARLRNDNPHLIHLIQIALGSGRFFEYVDSMKTSSAIPHISPSDIKNFTLSISANDDEIKLVSDYFQHLDSLIQSTTKKIESLKQVKAASLQTMFPQEGETTPRVRFNGFEGEWEKVSLKKYAKRINRKNKNMESTLALTISSIEGLVSQIDYFNNLVVGANLANYYLLKNGEFAYNKSYSRGYPFGSVKRLDRYDQGILSTLYIVFSVNDEISSDYLARFFDTTLWHKPVAERAEEGARNHGLLNIGADDFMTIDIVVPTSRNEQQQIADFFTNLDSQITLQTQRLEKLKQIKSACLDNMFV